MPGNPEQPTRETIDAQLAAAGWLVQASFCSAPQPNIEDLNDVLLA